MAETKHLVDFLDISEEITKFERSFADERRQIGRHLQGAFSVLAPRVNDPTKEEPGPMRAPHLLDMVSTEQ